MRIYRTKLIDDQRSANPRYKNMLHGTGMIIREEGIRGIYRYARLALDRLGAF